MSFWRATSRAGFVLVVCLLWVGILAFPTRLWAANPPVPTPTRNLTVMDQYGFKVSIDEQAAYFAVIDEGCSTPSLECLVHNVSQFTAFEWVNNIMGPDQLSYLKTSDAGTNRPMATGGAVGGLVAMVGSMYSHPVASTGNYVADVLESANIVTPAYAQGLGFAALDPILDLWKTFRNIAYIFFVLLFVVIGFMIMFRQKMGQTAITAQQAIPRIILALVLVTFSYAIAGFAIDLMYLTMTLIIGVFGNVFPAGDNILGYNIFNLISTLISSVSNFGDNINLVQNIVGGFAGAENTATQVIGFLGGTMLTVILAIAVLIGTVRLFFELLKSYATIVLSVVVAPVLIALDAIPGKHNFQTWMRTLVGHLSVFPVVLLVVVMFYVFTNGTVRATGGFMPPFLLGSGMSGNITSLMGLAIILALPDIVKHIRDAIAPKNAFASMITSGAAKNAKEAWSGKVPLGFNAKNITKGVGITAAGAAVGGTAGAVYGAKHGGLGKAVKYGFAGTAGGAVAPAGIVLTSKALGRVNKFSTKAMETANSVVVASSAVPQITRFMPAALRNRVTGTPPAAGGQPAGAGNTNNPNMQNPVGGP